VCAGGVEVVFATGSSRSGKLSLEMYEGKYEESHISMFHMVQAKKLGTALFIFSLSASNYFGLNR